MYTPQHFEEKDREKLLSFMKQYPFAILVTRSEESPVATHLPFLVEERKGEVFLLSHMAKANEQWYDFQAEQDVLVIFSEPHAYISTAFYGDGEQVPTWNYVAIHAYGHPDLLESDEEKKQLLEKTISTFHPPDLEHYNALPGAYVSKMLKGIVAFEIKLRDLQGKYKMSQNRKEEERRNILHHFEHSGDAMQLSVARLIRESNPEK